MKTPPTVSVPLPTDYRLLSLAHLLSVSKRDALGATVVVWAWIQEQAKGGIIPRPVVLLDGVAEIEGYGDAAVAVGLVGTVDGHIVAPAELRQADAQDTVDHDGGNLKRRTYERNKKRHQRRVARLTGKPKATTPKADSPPTSTTPSRAPRRLGSVASMDITLLWSKRNEAWFYKCEGATPQLTGTVIDPDNVTLAAALKALLNARLSQTQREKGKLVQPVFSPSMDDLVSAARQEREARQAAVAAAVRVDDANEALARAADDDGDQGDQEPEPAPPTGDIEPEGVAADPSPPRPADAEDGDIQGTTRGQHGDTGTCPQNVPIGEACDRVVSPCADNGLGAVPCPPKCPPDTTGTRPSSSSSSLNEMNEDKDTTTTKATADRERDTHADQSDDFSRYVQAAGCLPALTPEQVALVQRLADALGTTPDPIREQGRYRPDVLTARCHAAGIDPKTGFPLTASPAPAGDDAPTSPQDAPGSPSDTGTGVQTETGVQAAGGSVWAPATTPTGSPDDVDVARVRLSQGLHADDHAAGDRDQERDAEQGTAGSPQDDDAEQHRRRNEALRAIAAFSTTTIVTTSVTPPLNC